MQLSESLTIGIILTLVFGAVFYYLYSRQIQSEKRVSLLENILLDLKVAMESSLVKREELVEEVRLAPPPSPTIPIAHEEEYIMSAAAAEVDMATTIVSEMNEVTETPVTATMRDQYDNMTNKDLKETAKSRKIKGYTSMTRAELQEALRRSETDAGATVEEGTVTLDA